MAAPPALVVLGPGPERGTRTLLGLAILDRILLALERGGVGDVEIVSAEGPTEAEAIVARRPRKLAARVVARATAPTGPLLLIAGDAVINIPAVVGALASTGTGGRVPGIAHLAADEAARAADAATDGFDAAAKAAGIADGERPRKLGAVAIRIGLAGPGRAASTLLDSLKKPTDSTFAYHFTRNLSRQLTRLIVRTPITPNMLTLTALACGIVCGVILINAHSHLAVTGGYAVALLGEVFDCSDGEVARVAYRFSKIGTWLDTIVDDISSSIIHLGTAYVLYHVYDQHLLGWIALGAAGGFIFSRLVMIRELILHVPSGDAQALRWWIDSATAHEAGAEQVERGRPTPADFVRAISNREILIALYVVGAAVHLLPVASVIFTLVAAGFAFIAAGQLIVGSPEPPAK